MKKANEQTQAMQRVKVGMTGLAVVLLLIGLASAIFSSASREAPVSVPGAPKAGAAIDPSADNMVSPDEVKEPLAELGVTPSTATEAQNTTAPAKSVGTRP